MDSSFFKDFDTLDLGTPQQGKFLISEPFLADPNFSRTVVLLVEHNEDGTIGFVLNRELDIPLNEAVTDFPAFDAPISIGGPVENTSLFYIHTLGEKLPGSTEITEGLYWGGDFDGLKLLIDTKQITTAEIRFFAGYSGWGNGQLASEMKQRSWIVANASKEMIMNTQVDSLWKTALKKLGSNFAKMANFPEDSSLN